MAGKTYLDEPIYKEIDRIIVRWLETKHPQNIEDYYSLCWIKVLEHKQKLDEERGSLQTFIVYIVRRTISNYLIRNKRIKRVPTDLGWKNVFPSKSDSLFYEDAMIDYIDLRYQENQDDT